MDSKHNGVFEREQRLDEVVLAYLKAVEAGQRPDHQELLDRHADLLPELAQFFEDADALGGLALRPRSVKPAAALTCESVSATILEGKELGDFRIVREVGKGGMGIVYEAEQLSLRRRVALKVLPFAATMDPRHLQRFHNEARAAACLHHTNIVPVHFVGCERGVHFYAMQFIDGQPLSDIIRQLRQAEKKTPTAEENTVAYQPSGAEAATTPSPAAEITPLTGEGRRSRDYYRKVAELGIQAAEALDHAHQWGIVHRDIKPGNLILDGRGNLWVTDFGLAHMQHSEASLTATGQMMGTPRYMSPEQALAKRVPIDHRTDVYSLGVTLYELLTLRPAFWSEDGHELLRQIAFEEPARPRRLERAIPAELETIVLKAMDKRPQDRYATAKELADDLERWVKHEPIRARRPSVIQVAQKWMRRHQSAVWAASLLLFVLMIVGVANALWWVQKRTKGQTQGRLALREAGHWAQQERWSEALSAIHRAQGVIHGFWADTDLQRQVDELGKDVEMAQRLEDARLQFTAVEKSGGFDAKGCIDAYTEAFAWYGLDVEHGDAGVAAESIRLRSIVKQLMAALDHWASLQRLREDQEWRHLLAVARAADSDDWRKRFRDAWEHGDGKAMNDLLASAEVEKQFTTTLSLLGISNPTPKNVSIAQAADLLRRAQQRHPADFWVNHDLAFLLMHTEPPQLDEAISFYRVAVALRAQSPGVHLNFGNALKEKGRLDEAITEYKEAIRLKKDYAEAHSNLGIALQAKGRLDEAIDEHREAIRHKPDNPVLHANFGNVLREIGQLDEATGEYREALRIKKDYAVAHYNLGIALRDKGQLNEAIGEYREALRIKKDFAEAHGNLGNALRDKGQLDEAITEYREFLRINKDDAMAHNNLSSALWEKGQLDEAIAECREALRIKKDFALAHYNLGNALKAKGQLDEAIGEYREALRIKKNYADAHNNLGNALAEKGQLDEAISEYCEALRIKKDYAHAHNNLGVALKDKGQLDEAIAEYREAIRLKKDFAGAHANLGLALQRKGQLVEAIAEYREAAIHLKKDVKLARILQDALAERAIVAKLQAILSGEAKANNPAEQLALGRVCQQPYKGLYAAAVQFYLDAFTAQPRLADDLNAQHRYNAACAAALAGCGQGKDADKLDSKEHSRLRQQALDWLRADLKAYRQVMEKSAGKAGPAIAQQMEHWLQDNDFAGVRDSGSLAKLPEAERKKWEKLWEEVETLRKRSTQQPKAASSARP